MFVPCDHTGSRQYARRKFSNGSWHICVQCLKCHDVVRLPEHNMRPFLRLDEVPRGKLIHDWIGDDQS